VPAGDVRVLLHRFVFFDDIHFNATATPAASATEAPSNTVWLCKPGLPDNPCESDLATTLVAADGSEDDRARPPRPKTRPSTASTFTNRQWPDDHFMPT
jgi:hypothetical protein